jgi:hypothetical protein
MRTLGNARIAHCGRWQRIMTLPHVCIKCGTVLLEEQPIEVARHSDNALSQVCPSRHHDTTRSRIPSRCVGRSDVRTVSFPLEEQCFDA